MVTSTLSPNPSGPYVPPKGRSYRLYLTIDGYPYSIRPLLSDPFLVRRAFQLTKPDGSSYDVAQSPYGATCDCPDFIYRREGLDPAGCKHVRALVACGLIEREEALPLDRPAIEARRPSISARTRPVKALREALLEGPFNSD